MGRIYLVEPGKAAERACANRGVQGTLEGVGSLLSVLLFSLKKVTPERMQIHRQKRIKVIQNSLSQRKVLRTL